MAGIYPLMRRPLTLQMKTTASLLAALAFLLASATLRAQSAPANDNFANRQTIPSEATVSVMGTTIGATQEAFEQVNGANSPLGDGINEAKTVWYDWVPPVSGTVHAYLPSFTSMGDTYLLVFQGGSTPTLSQLIDQGFLPGDPLSGDSPPPDFAVTAGQEYTISLGNTNYPGTFTLKLILTPNATPTPAPVPTANVTAKGKADRSAGTPGKFVVSLSSAASADVTVNYKTSGTAINGTDYKPLPGSLIMPAGKTSATLKVKPRAGTEAVAVKLMLKTGDGYTVGSEDRAKVKIVAGD